MYPRREIEVSTFLSADSEYWTPKPSETDEEGYGLNFRDVWALGAVTVRDTRGVLQWERGAANWAAKEASDESQFELLARAAEAYPDDWPDETSERVDLPPELRDAEYGLCGLELGVAGLSYAMAIAGFYPVASCRSHIGKSWSEEPVVLFATGREPMRRLQPLIAANGCGLAADTSRGQPIFLVYAPSIVETMDLASGLFAKRGEFRGASGRDRGRPTQSRIAGKQLSRRPMLF